MKYCETIVLALNCVGMVLAAASNLSKQAEQLSGEVGTFLAGVRAA